MATVLNRYKPPTVSCHLKGCSSYMKLSCAARVRLLYIIQWRCLSIIAEAVKRFISPVRSTRVTGLAHACIQANSNFSLTIQVCLVDNLSYSSATVLDLYSPPTVPYPLTVSLTHRPLSKVATATHVKSFLYTDIIRRD